MINKTIQLELFHSFSKFKDKVAIEYKNKKILYQELDRKSDYIAQQLFLSGCKKGDKIGIYTFNADDLIISLIGVLKIGGIFIPLDTNLPLKTIEESVNLVNIDFLISDNEDLSKVLKSNVVNLNLTNLNDKAARVGSFVNLKENLAPNYKPDDPIYIFFTSGTTGTPNAILGKNVSLIHFIEWEIKEFEISNYRISQFITPGFDAILRDIFVPLISGSTICIPSKREIISDPNELKKWINDNKINLIHCVPSLLTMLLNCDLNKNDFADLNYVLLSGEKINTASLNIWFNLYDDKVQLVNLYGATETTMIRTFYRICPADIRLDRIPIGKPIDGTRALILDENMNVCDNEVIGELYIRTPYLTFGYYCNSELTKTKFIVNPFTKKEDDLIYKTGDLCKLRMDGNIDFIGRIDRQVKIRGIRIELEDIENRILKLSNVKEAVVHKFEELNDSIVAIIVPNDDNNIESRIRKYLSESLPPYMLPSSYIFVEKLPRKPNGKIAYDKLPPLLDNIKEKDETKTEIERKIYGCWEEILTHTNFHLNTSFFRVGGHSLNAILLLNRLKKVLDIKIPIQKIFQLDTIKEQARYVIENSKNILNDLIPKASVKDYYEPSSIQKRIFLHCQLNLNSVAYNVSTIVEIIGLLDIKKLANAFQQLVQRHESLRTSFLMIDGIVKQRVNENVDFKLELIKIKKEELTPSKVRKFIKPFCLTDLSLLKVTLFEIDPKHHILLFDTHHIVCDGFSVLLIRKELVKLYAGQKLKPLTIQFKDYCEWQLKPDWKEKIVKQSEFWKKLFNNDIEPLDLPNDFERPTELKSDGYKIDFEFNSSLNDKIEKLSKERKITVNEIIFTILNIFLSKLCNQNKIIIGTPVFGRSNTELENVVGPFINLVPIVNIIEEYKNFIDLSDIITNCIRNIYDNQDYPFEDMLQWLNFKRESGRNPLIDVTFIYRAFEENEVAVEGLVFREYPIKKLTTKFDLTLTVDKINSKYLFSFIFSTKIFKIPTIKSFIKYFTNLSDKLLENPHLAIRNVQFELENDVNHIEYLLANTLESE